MFSKSSRGSHGCYLLLQLQKSGSPQGYPSDMGGVEGRSRSVGVELARLVAIVALPLAGLIAFLLYDAARRDEEHASGLALQMAVTTADRTANYVDTVRRALETVAKRPMIRAMDPEHCDPQLAELREFYGKPAN